MFHKIQVSNDINLDKGIDRKVTRLTYTAFFIDIDT